MKRFLTYSGSVWRTVFLVAILWAIVFGASNVDAQAPIGTGTYSFKIYHVNYGFYPIVQAYIRSWDDSRNPLLNLNIANIGLQVKGRNYDPAVAIPTRQYSIETLERRSEGFRTVIVLDASGSMRGEPFSDALSAVTRFVEAKRPMDQVAVLAIRDESEGYQLVSNFENNPTLLYQRIADVQCDGQKTRLYDTVAAALEMCGTAFRGEMAALDYAVLSTIIILSDGKDEGSAISRDALLNRIGQLPIPIPIHSLAFTRIERDHLLNIEALSRATFGRYWDLDNTKMLSQTMQEIHRINRSDYVVAFRSYVPVDGDSHAFRVGVEFPSGSGSFLFSSASFEAIESPAVFNPALNEHYSRLKEQYQELPRPPFGDASGGASPNAISSSLEGRSELPNGISTLTKDMPTDLDEAAAIPVTAAADPPDAGAVPFTPGSSEFYLDWLRSNALMLGVGVAIILLLLGVIVIMKSGRRSSPGSPADGTSTNQRNDISSRTTERRRTDTDTTTQPVTPIEFGRRG